MVVISHIYGSGDEKKINQMMYHALYLGIILSVTLAIIGVFNKPLVQLMGAEENVTNFANIYLFYVLIPAFFMVSKLIMASALRGVGDTRTPFLVSLMGNILDLPLNYLLIFGKFGFPKLGVIGAAITTSFCNGLSAIILFWMLFSKRKKISLSLKDIPRIDFSVFKQILVIGVPTSIERFIFSFGHLTYASLVLTLGTSAFAAHRIALSIDSISFLPAVAFLTTALTMVGKYRGAKDDDGASNIAMEILKISCTILAFIGIIFLLIPKFLASIYTPDAEIIRLAVTAVRIIGFNRPLLALHYTMVGALRGAGDTRFPLILNTMGIWLIRVPLTYLLITHFQVGFIGAWIGLFADTSIKSFISFTKFRQEKWRSITVIND
jgi:putative MATE family efflux protein